MKISEDVLAVLDSAAVDGNKLVLRGQLDRKLYQDVNKVLEAIGGKWNRGAKAHVFDMPVADVIEPIMETGEYSRTKQDFGQFDTPPDLAAEIVRMADIAPGMWALEPEAGIGNIVLQLEAAGADVTAFEVDAKRLHIAKERCSLTGGIRLSDFLSASPSPIFDRVVMNPPFARQADIDHVLHAMKFLKSDGRLVSIMSASVLYRSNRKTAEFREFVQERGSIERLPDGAFKESGTLISTVAVTIDA